VINKKLSMGYTCLVGLLIYIYIDLRQIFRRDRDELSDDSIEIVKK